VENETPSKESRFLQFFFEGTSCLYFDVESYSRDRPSVSDEKRFIDELLKLVQSSVLKLDGAQTHHGTTVFIDRVAPRDTRMGWKMVSNRSKCTYHFTLILQSICQTTEFPYTLPQCCVPIHQGISLSHLKMLIMTLITLIYRK
jgi:hypothetical protein